MAVLLLLVILYVTFSRCVTVMYAHLAIHTAFIRIRSIYIFIDVRCALTIILRGTSPERCVYYVSYILKKMQYTVCMSYVMYLYP